MKYKVLFVHNKYGVHSGEEVMLDKIMQILADNGHEVRLFSKDSKELGVGALPKIGAFFSGIFSFSSRIELKKVVEEFQPNIIQIQNLFPLISPSVLPMLNQMGMPVVMRLSNYRLICPNGLFLSYGQICEKCRGGHEYYCVLKNCENSLFKSLGYAVRNFVARYLRLYKENVTRYYSQTEFQKNIMVSEGYPQEIIDVIPNMTSPTNSKKLLYPGDFVGYVGRMSREKGIDIFLEVARLCPDIPFKIAGNPQAYVSPNKVPDNVEILGHLNEAALAEFYRNCRFIILPSLCYEGFPSVIIEAMSFAKPVIASRIGGLSEIVEDEQTGLLFESGNVNELRMVVARLWEDEDTVYSFGQAGRAKVIKEYSPESYYKRLIKIYDETIKNQPCQTGREG